MSAKHTPAPWMFCDAGPDSGNVVRAEIYGPDEAHIADLIDPALDDEVKITDAQFVANGRLIECAPEMLDLLKRIAAAWSKHSGVPPIGVVIRLTKDINNLIAKAKGRAE